MSKEAMKLALEGAANYIDALGGDSRKYRQALAEQSVQQQEPVAIVAVDGIGQIQIGWMKKPQHNDKLYTSPPAQRKPLTDDTRRLDALAENSWDLRCFDMPTGAGDADIGWRVIEHHMAKPHERTVGEVYQDDPRKAIDRAIEAKLKEKNT